MVCASSKRYTLTPVCQTVYLSSACSVCVDPAFTQQWNSSTEYPCAAFHLVLQFIPRTPFLLLGSRVTHRCGESCLLWLPLEYLQLYPEMNFISLILKIMSFQLAPHSNSALLHNGHIPLECLLGRWQAQPCYCISQLLFFLYSQHDVKVCQEKKLDRRHRRKGKTFTSYCWGSPLMLSSQHGLIQSPAPATEIVLTNFHLECFLVESLK